MSTMVENFKTKEPIPILEDNKITWKTPSNIALVKYWGKRKSQLPQNPSVSFTLKNCHTTTSLAYQKKTQFSSDDFSFEIIFEGKKKNSFRPKIQQYFERIQDYIPFIKKYHFTIISKNSFPHSSGIASSASFMGSLSMCLMDLEKQLNPEISEDHFYKKASFLARLGSGSACRSIKGDIVVWGEHEAIEGSSDLYGVPLASEVDTIFKEYQNTILLVDKKEKKVSSTKGHDLMYNHPFAKSRFRQANDNIEKIKYILKTGNLPDFVKLIEIEALTLHAMMMTSHPCFILMKPNTLGIINKIWEYRISEKSNVCFTLDAGANVHLLYPKNEKKTIHKFVEEELSKFCKDRHFINDEMGKGSEKSHGKEFLGI